MKKIISTLLVCVLLVGSLLALGSCSKTVSGTYEGEVELLFVKYTVSYKFSGNKVDISSALSSAIGSLDSTPVSATYQINETEEGDLTITFNYGDADEVDGAAEGGIALPFAEGIENGKKYISIAGIKYFQAK